MPLMDCPDCGKEISDAAISCPNCGLPRPYYELQSRARRQQVDEAHREHAELVRNLFIGAAILGVGALGLLVVVVLSPWSSAAIGMKGKEALLAIALGAVGYGLYREGRRRQAAPPKE